MRVIFMGTPEFSVSVLEALHGAGHDIVAVYSQPPRPAGRGKKPRPSPVQKTAEQLGLPVFTPLNFKDKSDLEVFASHDVEIAVVVAYGLILPQSVLDTPLHGCLNIHASLLPRWRGAAPIQRAIMAGDLETGVCIMQMEAGLDTGPVIARKATPITAHDTAETLHDRLAGIGAALLVDVLASGKFNAEPQSEGGVTYAAKIDKAEARVDWTQSSDMIDRQIRALSPFPGAWCEIKDERVKLLGCELVSGSGTPGLALNDQFTIACGQGAIRLTRLQRAGKGPMDATNFARGFPLLTGEFVA